MIIFSHRQAIMIYKFIRKEICVMKIPAPRVDYRGLRLNNLNSPQYSHVKLLAYWPVFGFVFWFADKLYPAQSYIVVQSPIDSMIPFCELFVFPYVLWYFYLIGIHVYTFFYDVEAFKKLMKYIILTYSISLVIYYLYPTCQLLRPTYFKRQNMLTEFMRWFYTFDTNTNVCPSLHVIGSMAVMHTAWNTKGLNTRKWKTVFAVTTFLISISTVFLKQHSVIDILVALPICMVAYKLCFDKSTDFRPDFKNWKKRPKRNFS